MTGINLWKAACLAVLILVLVGCMTPSRARLRILVLEPGTGAVAGAQVVVDGEPVGLTDGDGRLSIVAPRLRQAEIRIDKHRYEPAHAQVRPTNADELLLVQIASVDGLIVESMQALDEGATAVALDSALRAYELAPDEAAACAMLAIAAYRAGEFDQALSAARALERIAPSDLSSRLFALLDGGER